MDSHMGLQQAWRDNLESLAYALLYIRCGKLPWQSIAIRNPTDPATTYYVFTKYDNEVNGRSPLLGIPQDPGLY